MSNSKLIFPKRALISVSDKTNLIPFAKKLMELNIEIISTGGTLKTLQKENIAAISVEDVTHFPEMMNGRIKTLHPNLLAGILGDRLRDENDRAAHNIEWIDLVVCNLYPFKEVIQCENATLMDKIENIDVGGPTMIRAAAKNVDWVTVITDVNDYHPFLDTLVCQQGIDFNTRQRLSLKAFYQTASYDALIANHFNDSPFPEMIIQSFKKISSPRYGENPHQQAAVYQEEPVSSSLIATDTIQGKAMSYNNFVDANAAVDTLSNFKLPTVVIVKHASPCGIASHDSMSQALSDALATDLSSAFGGVVALNACVNDELATKLNSHFFEIIIAPAFSERAKSIFSAKKNLRLIAFDCQLNHKQIIQKPVTGGLLCQETDNFNLSIDNLELITGPEITNDTFKALDFAWRALKKIKSNAILISCEQRALGLSGGQVSRIDATKIALEKAGQNAKGAILSSDAFFPFRDCIDLANTYGIKTILQPGGSRRDDEVIQACREFNMQLIFTHHRCFYH